MKQLSYLVCLLLCSLCMPGQSIPSLEIYTSQEGYFQFAYPDSFEVWAGTRIPKAKQIKGAGFIPVCDPETAFVCVMYPPARFEDTNFEAAGFSVNNIQSAATEEDCLGYSDYTAPPRNTHLQTSSVTINGLSFSQASDASTVPGHSQSARLYRSFHHNYCYELRVSISLSDAPPRPSSPDWRPFVESDAENVRASLRRVLGTFYFTK